MSEEAPPRPGSAPTPPLRLRIWHVPDEGGVTVRFLANPLGILTHGPKLRFPCPGMKHCRECSAGKRAVWKGFAACEVWIEESVGCAWLPAVLEVSDRLAEYLGSAPLRGLVWYCYRQLCEAKFREVAGHQVDVLSPSALQPAFDVTAVVMRAYGTHHIEWGRQPPLKPRPFIRPVTDEYIPPTASAGMESPEAKHARELEEQANILRLKMQDPVMRRIVEARNKGKQP